MNFPAYTKTKTEAQRLAAELFPKADNAIGALPAGTHLPRYQLQHTTADTLRAVFYWLHEQRPKIYKRARWHLFYDMAANVIAQIDDNAQAKVRELYNASDSRRYFETIARKEAAELVTGDGQGI